MNYNAPEIQTYGKSQLRWPPPGIHDGIRDTDLLKLLDGLQGAPGYRIVYDNLVRQQEERDIERAMTPVARRRKANQRAKSPGTNSPTMTGTIFIRCWRFADCPIGAQLMTPAILSATTAVIRLSCRQAI